MKNKVYYSSNIYTFLKDIVNTFASKQLGIKFSNGEWTPDCSVRGIVTVNGVDHELIVRPLKDVVSSAEELIKGKKL